MNIVEQRRRTPVLLSAALLILTWALWQPRAVVQAQWTTNGNNINNTNTGSVGVGTSDPSLQGSVNSKFTIVQVDGQTAFSVGNTGGVPRFALNADANGSWTFYDFAGGTWLPGISQRLGNIGIGTSAPGALLEINKSQNAGTTMIMDNAYTGAGNSAYSGVFIKQAGANRFFFGSINNGNTAQNGGPGAVQLWNFVNGPMLFATNSVERVRIDGAGNVGIGTTTPIFDTNTSRYLSLDAGSGTFGSFGVGGNITSSAYPVGQMAFFNSNLGAAEKRIATIVGRTDGALNSGAIDFYTWNVGSLGSGPKMTIAAVGNVGIGTTTPAYRLDVAGQIRSSAGGFVFPDGTVQTTAATGGGGGGSSQWTTSGANIYYNTGSIGVGTASPTRLMTLNASATSYLSFNEGGAEKAVIGTEAAAPYNRRFIIYDSTAAQYRLVVDNAGNIGIGSTSPGAKLDIVSGGNSRILAGDGCSLAPGTYGGVGLGISSFNNCQNYALLSNGVELYVNAPSASGIIHFRAGNNSNNGTDYMTVVGGNGNVGIGTSSPQAKLDVQGNVSVTGNITATGNIAAKYQDVAEWVESRQKLSAGTVVILDSERTNQVIASTQSYDTRVVGVVSENPGLILGEGGEGKVKVATTGRVRVRVDASQGPIRVGDLLVTSDREGVAMKSVPVNIGGVMFHRPGTLIGKALEPLEKGEREIMVLLSLQ